MKPSRLALLATMAMSTLPTVLHAETGTTDPVGYVTETLKANSFNLVGITLHEATLAAGTFETVNGVTLTDNETNFGTLLAANTTYILEITSGNALGYIQEITSANASGNNLTTPDNLASVGLAVGDQFKIRKAATLSSLFGVNNSAGLKEGTSITTADSIWVQTGTGSYHKYFYHPGASFPINIPEGWKDTSLNNVSNKALAYTDGLMIQSKDSADKNIVFTGEVISDHKKIVILGGFNLIGTSFPIGTTLGNSGLQTQLKQGSSITVADVLWMPDGSGGFKKYFYHPGTTFPVTITAGWKDTSLNDASSIKVSGALLLQRQGDVGTTIITKPGY